MQKFGKRSKLLLIWVLAAMLITLGTSFALWDGRAALAATGETSSYADVKVGDVIEFGRYWQKASPAGYDDKDPIKWIVVDKDERTGQLTLLSKYILAYGSYFGNWYIDSTNRAWADASSLDALLDNIPHNQAWSESTARAFLNNLQRFDLGGDKIDAVKGMDNGNRIPSVAAEGKLKPSVGFSNALHYTGLSGATESVVALINDPNSGFISKGGEPYYQRPKVTDPAQRLARNGFLDEAFSPEEKQMIVPKKIPGQNARRWPANTNDIATAKYLPSTTDKVWLPSVEELNIKAGVDWNNQPNDSWTNSSESSTPFEYFKNWQKYNPASLEGILRALPTAFAGAEKALGNYSIPSWITDFGNHAGNKNYWTRSALATSCTNVRYVAEGGQFGTWDTYRSNIGVRPCILLKY